MAKTKTTTKKNNSCHYQHFRHDHQPQQEVCSYLDAKRGSKFGIWTLWQLLPREW